MRVPGWLGLTAVLTACYASPATHPVDEPPADGGSSQPDIDASDDADVAEEDGGATDSAQRDSEGPDASPFCKEPGKPVMTVTGACVECARSEDCTGDDEPVCFEARGECVQCLDNGSCADTPEASRCDTTAHACKPCEADADCSMVPGKNVCAEGQCVECTRANRDACGNRACNPSTLVCSDAIVDATALCGTCVSDDQCSGDAACVAVPAGGGGRVCQQVFRGAGCTRPYMDAIATMFTTADAESVRVCSLLPTNTNCAAHRDYKGATRCGVHVADQTVDEDQPNSGMNSLCGAPGNQQGTCLWSESRRQFRCSVPCRVANGADDCGTGLNCLPSGFCPI